MAVVGRRWLTGRRDAAVAAHAGYPRSQFVRAFKAAYGETPGQYLSRRRTDRAEELLRSADLSMTDSCVPVGFSSFGPFSACFKECTGLSPSAYRRKHVGCGAALIPGCYALLWTGGCRPQVGSASSEDGC